MSICLGRRAGCLVYQCRNHIRQYAQVAQLPVRLNDETSNTSFDVEAKQPSDSTGDAPSRFELSSQEPLQARHLLRAILRECTYLPDSFARAWLHQHAIERFRSYSYKAWKHRDSVEYHERLRSKQREARQAVKQLRRANSGERTALLKVLLLAYGRTGKRRHELMQPLLSKSGQAEMGRLYDMSRDESLQHSITLPPKSQALGPTSSLANKPSAKEVNRGATFPYVPEFSSPMRALLQSQIRNPPPKLTRSTLRRFEPRIEELNSWHRPMPRVRVKNATKQWYANLLERVHPPLPSTEWERLRDLATGALSEAPVGRRASTLIPERKALEAIVMYGKPSPDRVVRGRPTASPLVTARFMQRLWAQVFAQCPRLDWNTERDAWTVTWGEHALHSYRSSHLHHPESHDTGRGVE